MSTRQKSVSPWLVLAQAILYLFDCGPLGDDESRIRVDGVELDAYEWVDLGKLGEYVISRLERRIRQAHAAWLAGRTMYLEHGASLVGSDADDSGNRT